MIVARKASNDITRLLEVKGKGFPLLDSTELAITGANIAEDEEGSRSLRETPPLIGAMSLLADSV